MATLAKKSMLTRLICPDSMRAMAEQAAAKFHASAVFAYCNSLDLWGIFWPIMEFSELNALSLSPQALRYFHILEIDEIGKLKEQNPRELYSRLCRKTETPQNPEIIGIFAEAIAKAQESSRDSKTLS